MSGFGTSLWLMYMTRILAVAFSFLFALPSVVHAHASPVAYTPSSSETVTEAPSEVVIRFSERPEPGASRIVVTDDTGTQIQEGRASVALDDPRLLSVPVRAGTKGAYFVSWSVVSADDGHFTKGGFTYFVGDNATIGTQTAPQVEVVQLSALPEATAIAVELFGNSLLLASVFFFAFVLRPRMPSMEQRAVSSAQRICWFLSVGGVVFALVGALTHMALKTYELAALHSIGIGDAVPLYVATTSGSATLIRACAVAGFALVFFLRRRHIARARRFSLSECVLVLFLVAFAFFRSIVSHTTANPFATEFGIAVNFVHLFAKDLSAGVLVALVLVMLMKPLREHAGALLTRGFRMLVYLFAPLAASASYIVWLHLKSPENITTTLWGERFVPLVVSALVAGALLFYHVLGMKHVPSFVRAHVRYTLPAEALAALLIVFFSALMIITSPPLHGKAPAYEADSNGVRISLAPSVSEDGYALLTFSTKSSGTLSEPTVMLDGDSVGGTLLSVEKRFINGYAFKSAVLQGESAHSISISVSQESGYDARAEFTLTRAGLTLPAEGDRALDLFAVLMAFFGLSGIACSVLLLVESRMHSFESVQNATLLGTLAAGIAAGIVISQIIGVASFLLRNQLKEECITDGNAWHLMLPTREGKPVSSTPAEGCMALNGAFHIADAREYRFLKNPAPTSVSFSTDFSTVSAGLPTALEFSIRTNEGAVPRLVAQHERLVHVIIISKDMTEFFHVHPDDLSALTTENVSNATFSVPFTFPKAGKYLIGIDYASGLSSRNSQMQVEIGGVPQQEMEASIYPLRTSHEGYELTLQPGFPVVGQPATLVWRIEKDGEDVLDLEPYLAAAMHVAVIKDDFSEFVHAHGEVHLPGAPVPAASPTGVHNHAPPPPRFGPLIEAHPVFPSAGVYTIFAQFKHRGEVISVPFTLRVE
jgi:methionine-rich copper-binding protein CopC